LLYKKIKYQAAFKQRNNLANKEAYINFTQERRACNNSNMRYG